MTTNPNDNPLLNQILSELRSFGERLAVVEADLKTVIRDHTKDLDDHETRLRVLEATVRNAVTRDDLDDSARDASISANRKANLRLGVATFALSLVVLAVNVALTRI